MIADARQPSGRPGAEAARPPLRPPEEEIQEIAHRVDRITQFGDDPTRSELNLQNQHSRHFTGQQLSSPFTRDFGNGATTGHQEGATGT
jgi:hypothetical protein